MHEDILGVIRCYAPVKERRPTRRYLFLSQVLVEEHWCIRDGPGEVDVLAKTLRGSDTILQCAFVEHIGRELRATRVHTILDLKSNWAVAKDNKALEKRLCEASAGGFLVHNDRSELLMVANQDNLFATKDERNHALWTSRFK